MLHDLSLLSRNDFKNHKWFYDGILKKQEIQELEQNRTVKNQEIMKVFSGQPKTTFNVQRSNQQKIARDV